MEANIKSMKRNLLVVLFFLVGFAAMAQVPQKFSYQALARDKNGQALANQQVAIEIIIKQNNNAVFTEKQTTQTNDFGLFTLEIGSKSPLNNVNWSQGLFNMDIKIDPNGGSNYELLGTIQLLAVPYALYADRANERQRLKLDNNKLSIVESGGVSEVTLPTSGTGNGDNWGIQTVETSPVLKGKGTSADPLSIASQGAVNGQVLQWNGTTWVPGTINISGGDGWGNQVAKTNTATITGDGSATSPLNLANNAVTSDKIVDGGVQGVDINQMNATDGQVLKWLNNSWQPANDNATGTGGAATYSGVNGINVNNTTNVISLNPLIFNTTTNELSISGGNKVIIPTGSGSTTVTTNATLSGNGTTGAPLSIAPQGATNGQVLKWNGTTWQPANDDTGTGGVVYTQGTGISISGNNISNTGDLSNTNEIQQLSINGSQLTITGTGGNTVTLPTSTSGTSYTAGTGISIANNIITNTGDNDNSATNEIQNLSISGNQLTITGTGGNTVTLPSSGGTTYTAGTGISITGNTISNTGDTNASDDITTTTLSDGDINGRFTNLIINSIQGRTLSAANPTNGQVLTYNSGIAQWIPQTPTTGGSSLWTEYTQGSEQGIVTNSQVVKIGNTGSLTLRPDAIRMPECPPNIFCLFDGWTRIETGRIEVQGSSGSTAPVATFGGSVTAGSLNVGNVTSTGNISATGNATVTGDLDVKNARVRLTAGTSGNGNVITYNLSNQKIASMEGQGDGTGTIMIWNSTGTAKAGMNLTSNGQGYIFADAVSAQIKNFKVPHPTKKDKDIWYASLEGPEAAMYERGTATLKNGEAFIPYSETFQLMLSPNTATMNLTPQYWDTFGLAVIEKNDKGFRVKELKGGTGNFKFDWEVKGVRKGYENYQVVRDKEDNQSEKSEFSIKDEPLRDGLPEKAKVDATIKN
jgi:hypothetical protein